VRADHSRLLEGGWWVTVCRAHHAAFFLAAHGEREMDAKLLRDLARRYRENHEFITNEEMTKQSLIVPFIVGLGYDPSNP
jgi:hypothetical protein